MSQHHDEEAPQVYYIPGNYDDSGGVFGGRIGTRNAVELAVFCGPIAYLEYKFLHFSIQTNLIIAIVTLLPLAALCVFGVGGETLSQILFAFVRYQRNRRQLHYDMFSPNEAAQAKKFSLDKFLDIASSSGVKAALAKFKEEHIDDSQPKQGAEKQDEEHAMKEELRRQERAIKGQTKGWLSAARKDKGHKKLNNPTARRKK